jgi:hypothetical protein
MTLPMNLPVRNLAVQILEEEGADIQAYDGQCAEVTDMVLNRYTGEMVWVDGPAVDQYGWWYHAVPFVDGLIHDAWLAGWHEIPEPQPLEEWLIKMFGTDEEISITISGAEIYSGLTQNYSGEVEALF